jgi:hypothetical protein
MPSTDLIRLFCVVDFDYREAPKSEIVFLESVQPILHANLTNTFVCQTIKFLFSKPYILFQLITREANGSESMGDLTRGIITFEQ